MTTRFGGAVGWSSGGEDVWALRPRVTSVDFRGRADGDSVDGFRRFHEARFHVPDAQNTSHGGVKSAAHSTIAASARLASSVTTAKKPVAAARGLLSS
jgi:hypothetical protein